MLEQYAFFRMQRDRSDDNSSARESPVVCAQDSRIDRAFPPTPSGEMKNFQLPLDNDVCNSVEHTHVVNYK